MMAINEMKKRLQTQGLSYKQLAARSGVPLSTIQKIMSGATRSPRYDTLCALEKALGGPLYSGWSSAYIERIHEEAAAYQAGPAPDIPDKKPGDYTLEDYLALPEDRRVELIDGVFYDMTGPSYTHQYLVGQIYHQLFAQAETHTCPCHPFISPADVQLDCDNKTIVQPDVLVICDLERIIDGRYFGAPDLVVEVLSPSTRNKDLFLKAGKYQRAGVRELWIVDPKERRVMVYDFRTEETQISIYGFEDRVPVLISDGDCVVDFTRISQGLAELFPHGEYRENKA